MLDDTAKTPYGTPIDKLIHYFSKKKDVSFMYVIHDMDSSFVAYRKNKSHTSGHQSDVNEKYISVYKVAVEAWRNELKVSDSEKILVAFAYI